MSHQGLLPLDKKVDKEIYRNAPTAVNLALLIALRLSDCRGAKATAGALYHIGEATAQNDVIKEMEQGKLTQEQALDKARDVRRVQLVNLSLYLHADIKVDEKGEAIRKDGYWIKNPESKIVKIESHDVNLLVQRKPTGEIEQKFLSCTFYNGEYLDDKGNLVRGAIYNLRVPITQEMVTMETKDGKVTFKIDLTKNKERGVDTGLLVRDEKGELVDDVKLIATISPHSHSHELSHGGVRKFYSANQTTCVGASMEALDLLRALEMQMHKRLRIIAKEVRDIVNGPVPTQIPPGASQQQLSEAANKGAARA
jgi:hypothetical protein